MASPSGNFPIETPSHDALDEELTSLVQALLIGLSPQEQPYLVHMLGVPGAGKTTLAKQLHRRLSATHQSKPLYLGFDDIMASIPGYLDEADPIAAHARYEHPARAAGYALLKEALTRRIGIVFDHGGANRDHIRILEFAKNQLGYRVAILYLPCEPQLAKARIERRSATEPRHTPAHYVDERANLIAELLPAYTELSERLFTSDNSPTTLDTVGACDAISEWIAALNGSAAK